MEVTDDEADEDEDTFKPPQVKLVCFILLFFRKYKMKTLSSDDHVR